MTDNPFSEPDDSDRTIIRPMPGGKRPVAPAAPVAPPPGPSPFDAPVHQFAAQPPARAPSDAPETIGMGGSPLLSAAGPLLQLLARLRNTMSQPDSGDLRERAVREVRRFEEVSRAQNIPMEQ